MIDKQAMTIRLPRDVYESLRRESFETRRPMNALIADALAARTVTAAEYGQVCDAIERGYQGLPPLDTDDPFLHTSDEARRAAHHILDILGVDVEDPSASHTRKASA